MPLGAASANGEAQRSSSAGAAAHSGGGASLLPNEGDHYNMQVPSSTIFEDIEVPHYEPRVASGRITVMTIAEGMDRGRVEELLKEKVRRTRLRPAPPARQHPQKNMAAGIPLESTAFAGWPSGSHTPRLGQLPAHATDVYVGRCGTVPACPARSTGAGGSRRQP